MFPQVNSEILREKLERIVGRDDSAFSGIDLATLIRNKFGRSYDVQLIKKVLIHILFFILLWFFDDLKLNNEAFMKVFNLFIFYIWFKLLTCHSDSEKWR